MSKETNGQSDASRSIGTKETLAATGIALGAGATAATAAAQDDDDDDDLVVVLGDDYRPDVGFEVISSLETATKEDLIDDAGGDLFDDPDDWDAYVISSDNDGDAPMWGVLFTEDVDLDPGDSETMGDDGDFRDAQLNVIEVEL
ncbi:calcium-binding protein [Halosolutus amylolyticus]|uniref:Calcium-binding protein n=1 Tax=Halosolutus amylolyticus TaxID=2932267 RepID=A0ABD5PW56_9EURY|nr:calcium-binding protein [Halosolutus amylolyticus]